MRPQRSAGVGPVEAAGLAAEQPELAAGGLPEFGLAAESVDVVLGPVAVVGSAVATFAVPPDRRR